MTKNQSGQEEGETAHTKQVVSAATAEIDEAVLGRQRPLLGWMYAQVWFDVAQGLLVGEVQKLPGIAVDCASLILVESQSQVIPKSNRAAFRNHAPSGPHPELFAQFELVIGQVPVNEEPRIAIKVNQVIDQVRQLQCVQRFNNQFVRSLGVSGDGALFLNNRHHFVMNEFQPSLVLEAGVLRGSLKLSIAKELLHV